MPNQQAPLHSGFNSSTTAKEVMEGIDLSGKTAIITGGYSGIGLEVTRCLAEVGATVIAPSRTPDKAKRALAKIPRVEQGALDLADPDSVDAFAKNFLASGRPLHLLINNAGVMATPLTRDARGHEIQFATNHLGHFQLTSRLWSSLEQARGARVITLSSGGHRFSAFDFEDPDFERRDYDKWKAYGQSKTANVLFTVALDKRGKPHNIRAFAVHPGRITTDLQRFIAVSELQALGYLDDKGEIPLSQRALYKTVEQGAATTVWCATSPALNDMGGLYCENVDIAEVVPAGHKEPNGVVPWALDTEAAERLWALSEQMMPDTILK